MSLSMSCPRENQPVLERAHHGLDVDLVVAAVGMNADPVPRRTVRLEIPRPGGFPIIPDEIFAVLAGAGGATS